MTRVLEIKLTQNKIITYYLEPSYFPLVYTLQPKQSCCPFSSSHHSLPQQDFYVSSSFIHIIGLLHGRSANSLSLSKRRPIIAIEKFKYKPDTRCTTSLLPERVL
jgi:hypothetical protein